MQYSQRTKRVEGAHGGRFRCSLLAPRKKPGADFKAHTRHAKFNQTGSELEVGVTRGQHRGEPRYFFLAATTFTRLFEMPAITNFFQGAFAVDFLFQPAQRPIH